MYLALGAFLVALVIACHMYASGTGAKWFSSHRYLAETSTGPALPGAGQPSAPGTRLASSQSVAGSAVPEGVARYARDMELLTKSPRPVSFESILEEGRSVADALVRGDLERFDDATYEKVRTMMVGFIVEREEVIVAAPDADFFLKLAREKGTDVDRAFFEALKKTYPDGYWPAYSLRQTDYSGCTMFEGKELPDVYGAWVGFQKAHPDHYRAAAQKELTKVEEELGSTCACSGEDGVRKGLEHFLNAYPASPIAASVAARLQAIKNHTSNIRFNCLSG